MTRIARLALAAALIGVGSLSIAGCAQGPQPQSQAEACNVVSTDLSGISGEITSAFSEVSSGDVTAAIDVFSTLDAAMAKVDAKLEQPKVKAAFGDVRDAVTELADTLDPLLEEGAMNDVALLAEVTAASQTANTELVDAGEALNKLCAS